MQRVRGAGVVAGTVRRHATPGGIARELLRLPGMAVAQRLRGLLIRTLPQVLPRIGLRRTRQQRQAGQQQ